MRIGVDFDNTIVCYDGLIHRVACEAGLISPELPRSKTAVRNHLRDTGREPLWTELQGRIYGARMAEAEPYPGVIEFFLACRHAGIPVSIISHKTRHPILGEPHDLHRAAREWLESMGFFTGLGLNDGDVFFELTREDKLRRIAAHGCSHFIDDLPDFLLEKAFPPSVERLLFDPNDIYPDEPGILRFRHWDLLRAHLVGTRPSATMAPNGSPAGRDAMSEGHEVSSSIRSFLRRHRIGDEAALEPLPGGANNRVRRVVARRGTFVLKRYFRGAADARDRFGAERAFYEWAWDQGIRRTPEPLGWDAEEGLGLFSHVAGRRLTAEDVNKGMVDQALAFVRELNVRRAEAVGRGIPEASEACFAMAEHLRRVGERVLRLVEFQPASSLDRVARAFVMDELEPAWRAVRHAVCPDPGPGADAPLKPDSRCLSPSDFGFHNALLPEDGRLRFFDFEYAGWDDPAKLVCDFFCQPEVPVALGYWDPFVQAADVALGWHGALQARAELLLPVYRIKWCCIVLNEFLRGECVRREFAHGIQGVEDRKAAQLEKARRILERARVGAPTNR
jgi:hypothetical protein